MLDYFHKNTEDLFYHNAVGYINTEEEVLMDEIRDYDAITVEVSGVKLLEAYEYEREEAVSKADPESRRYRKNRAVHECSPT
jgi:hypothetical protein